MGFCKVLDEGIVIAGPVKPQTHPVGLTVVGLVKLVSINPTVAPAVYAVAPLLVEKLGYGGIGSIPCCVLIGDLVESKSG
jgi:hypothetical protein